MHWRCLEEAWSCIMSIRYRTKSCTAMLGSGPPVAALPDCVAVQQLRLHCKGALFVLTARYTDSQGFVDPVPWQRSALFTAAVHRQHECSLEHLNMHVGLHSLPGVGADNRLAAVAATQSETYANNILLLVCCAGPDCGWMAALQSCAASRSLGSCSATAGNSSRDW